MRGVQTPWQQCFCDCINSVDPNPKFTSFATARRANCHGETEATAIKFIVVETKIQRDD